MEFTIIFAIVAMLLPIAGAVSGHIAYELDVVKQEKLQRV